MLPREDFLEEVVSKTMPRGGRLEEGPAVGEIVRKTAPKLSGFLLHQLTATTYHPCPYTLRPGRPNTELCNGSVSAGGVMFLAKGQSRHRKPVADDATIIAPASLSRYICKAAQTLCTNVAACPRKQKDAAVNSTPIG